MPVRTALKTRTIFNILGPLANPAKPTHGVYGVYTPELLDVYADTLLEMGHEHALVVHGSGLDEIALHGPTEVRYLHKGKIEKMVLTPADFGFSESPLSAIAGDTPEYNVNAIEKVFTANGEQAHVNAIAMNAAALLWLHNPQSSLIQHTQTVLDAIENSLPKQTIERAAKISQGAN